MENIKQKILDKVKKGIDICLVGPTNIGKTDFIIKELIPYLKYNGITLKYFPNCEKIIRPLSKDLDVVIVDEVESLADKIFLEDLHPEEKPYYSPAYMKKVKYWHDILRDITTTCIYIITRNQDTEIKNLKRTLHKADWNGHPLAVLVLEDKN